MTIARLSWANLALGLVVGLTGAGCATRVSESVLPGDGYVVRCESGMLHCVRRADTLCGEKGFTIVSGREVNKVLGGPNSPYRKEVTDGELEFYCGDREIPKACETKAQDPNAVHQLGQAPPAAPVPPASAAPTATRLCVPGVTQRCVGPGACDGGQMCGADGLSFGSCDCGAKQSPPVAPTAPTAPAQGSSTGP